VRRWLQRGDLADAAASEIDDGRTGRTYGPVLDVADLTVNDLFSAGPRVPFHVTLRGPYRGGIEGVPDSHKGSEVTLNVAGVATVGADASISDVRAVTSRATVRWQLTGESPI
jgi:hypothetical protein